MLRGAIWGIRQGSILGVVNGDTRSLTVNPKPLNPGVIKGNTRT